MSRPTTKPETLKRNDAPSLFDGMHPEVKRLMLAPSVRRHETRRGFCIGDRYFGGGKLQYQIMRYFSREHNRGAWHNRARTLDKVFSDPRSPFFCGVTYDRQLRHLQAKGLLISEPDPNHGDQTHRWRLAPEILEVLEGKRKIEDFNSPA